jgi:hypothetical protein
MKKIVLSLTASLSLLSSLYGDENATIIPEKTYYGYNYIGFGMETATYQERGTLKGIPYKSSATATSPVYISGGLIKVNKYFDFSIDAASTLMPTESNEKWQNTSTGGLLQENKFDSVQSDLKFLFQYKINNNHRIAFGPNYNLFSMKRHDFSYKGQTIEDAVLNQEDIATLNMMIGYIYEYAPFSNGGMRLKTAAMYGKPIWNKATNTSAPDLSFSSTKGSTIDVDGYVGFELTKGLEMGVFGRYSLKNKDGADDVQVDGGSIIWPENELETFRYGVSFVWNFDAK